MTVECFLDTNIIVYAVAGKGDEDHKRVRTLDLIEHRDFGISAQVLQEFYVTVTRKIDIPLSADQAFEWIEQLEAFPCLPIDSTLIKIAVEISERYQLSYWDGAIIAAAQVMGADTLYSEDLNHGQKYGSVVAINPFRKP